MPGSSAFGQLAPCDGGCQDRRPNWRPGASVHAMLPELPLFRGGLAVSQEVSFHHQFDQPVLACNYPATLYGRTRAAVAHGGVESAQGCGRRTGLCVRNSTVVYAAPFGSRGGHGSHTSEVREALISKLPSYWTAYRVRKMHCAQTLWLHLEIPVNLGYCGVADPMARN